MIAPLTTNKLVNNISSVAYKVSSLLVHRLYRFVFIFEAHLSQHLIGNMSNAFSCHIIMPVDPQLKRTDLWTA